LWFVRSADVEVVAVDTCDRARPHAHRRRALASGDDAIARQRRVEVQRRFVRIDREDRNGQRTVVGAHSVLRECDPVRSGIEMNPLEIGFVCDLEQEPFDQTQIVRSLEHPAKARAEVVHFPDQRERHAV